MSEYDVFLSYNSDDREAVEIIARHIREEAHLEPFLDRWHLIPGEPWQEAIEEALGQSKTVAVFVGPSGISPWHNEEMRSSLAQAVRTRDDYRVIPVLLPGTGEEALTGFLARRTWVDFRPGLDDAEALERLVAGIRGEAVVSGVYELPDEPAPYRGLLRFEAEHRRFFFGRDTDRQRLLDKLAHHSFVVLVGASGSGKSSLVRAGVLPDLVDDALPGSREWRTLVFTPGSQPLCSLANQLTTLAPPLADPLETADKLTQRLAERTDGLRSAATAYLADRPRPLLLVVDQFEELFTLCEDKPERCRAQVEQFVANLADAVRRGDGQIRVLIILRADFLDRCLAFPVLRDLLEDRQVLLSPLDEPALREAIIRPAQVVGAFFEKGLVNTILRDVEAEPGALPLLQHALYELWRARRGPWLTLTAYEASGGVRGALQRRAQATYDALPPEQQATARNILLRLTALGEGVSDTRRRVERSELYLVGAVPGQVDAVLHALSSAQARLVVVDEESVEMAHEALIQQWGTLREWLVEDQQALRLHRRLTQAAQEWEGLDRDVGALYRGARLAQVEEWASGHADAMNALEHEFLLASAAERDKEAQAQARAARRLRWAVAILALLFVAAALWAFKEIQRNRSPWQRVAGFPDNPVSAIASAPGDADPAGPRFCAGTTDIGLCCSRTGRAWDIYSQELPVGDPAKSGGIFPTIVRGISALGFDATDPQRMFLGAFGHGVFRSDDGGLSLEPANAGLPDDPPMALAVDGRLVLAVFDRAHGSELYASLDGGGSWSLRGGDGRTPLGRTYAAHIAPGGKRVYVGTEYGVFTGRPGPDWAWTQALESEPVHFIAPAVGTEDTYFLLSYERKATLYRWQPGGIPVSLATFDDQPRALTTDPNLSAPAVAYVLLYNGDVFAVSDSGDRAPLGRRPGWWPFDLAFELLAVTDPADGSTRLWLGHSDGLLEYTDALPLPSDQ